MKSKIQQIVNGKSYDTETASLVASDEYWDGHNWERHGRNTHLYKTKKGAFFIAISTMWQGELDHIQPITLEEAKEQYEQLQEHILSYGETFGEDPEEA